MHDSESMNQFVCNQHLELDLHDNQVDIDKLHFDSLLCKWHYHHKHSHHKHHNKCVLNDYIAELLGNQCCKHMEHFYNQTLCYKDHHRKVQVDIDILRYDYCLCKLLVDHILRLHKLVDIVKYHQLLHIFLIQHIRHLMYIDFDVLVDNRFYHLDFLRIQVNIDIH